MPNELKLKKGCNSGINAKRIVILVLCIQLIVLMALFISCFGNVRSYDILTSDLNTEDIREGISVVWSEENLQIENDTGKVIVMTFHSDIKKLFSGTYDLSVQYISQKSSDESSYNANASTGYCNVVGADDEEANVVKMDELVFRDGQTWVSGKLKVSNGLTPANLQVRICYEGEGTLQISAITLTESKSDRWLRFFGCVGLFCLIDVLGLLMHGEKTRSLGDRLFVFFVCFIPKFINAISSVMVNYISDDVSAMSVAALVAGYDWRDVVSNAGYYGIGYLFIFFPLFKMGISAITIYRIILSMNAVLIGLTGIICYAILERFFKIENRLVKIAISATCGCISIFSTEITGMLNEEFYLLCGWIFAYLVLNLLDDTVKRRRKYEIGLFLIMVYMLTVHTRAVTYIIAFALICLGYWILSRKKLVSKAFWIVGAVGAVAVEMLLKIYQQWIWQSDSVRNSSVGDAVSSAASQIVLDFTMVKSSLMIILGQFFTAFSLSGGLFVIAFVVFMLFIGYCCRNKGRLRPDDINLLILGSLYGFMILFTICGQSITWGVGVYDGLISGTTDYVYSYKSFTYMRYMGSYVPVFMMTALVIAYDHWDIWKKSCRLWSPIVFLILFVFWNNEVLQYLKNSVMEFFVVLVVRKAASDLEWSIMFVLLILLVCFWMFLCYRKAFAIQLLLVGVLFISFERIEIFNTMDIKSQEANLEYIDSSYAVMEELKDKLILDESLDVCAVEAYTSRTDHQIWYLYQFMLYDLHIIPGSQEDITETEIVLSNGGIDECLSDDYVCFKLDDNEYLYSKNENYTTMIEEMGYEAE